MTLALDHLVIAARTLAEGLDWCEATLGLRPEAGGRPPCQYDLRHLPLRNQ